MLSRNVYSGLPHDMSTESIARDAKHAMRGHNATRIVCVRGKTANAAITK